MSPREPMDMTMVPDAAGTDAGTDADADADVDVEPDTGPDAGADVDAGPDTDAIPLVPEHRLDAALEALLLVVDAPVPTESVATAVGRSSTQVHERLAAISARLTGAGSGMDLRHTPDGWRLYTRAEFAPVVERFVMDGTATRLSRAALETLAVIAYRQPVTRSRIAAVRGVNVDGVVRTLLARGMIDQDGIDPDTGGILYRTTELFLERMGLSGIDELPPLGPLLPDVDEIDDE